MDMNELWEQYVDEHVRNWLVRRMLKDAELEQEPGEQSIIIGVKIRGLWGLLALLLTDLSCVDDFWKQYGMDEVWVMPRSFSLV